MSDTTPRSALPLLAAAQSQKHVTHNEALLELDALLSTTILDRDLSAPPSPSDGDTYLVKATGTGAWTGQDGKLAYAIDGGWRFYVPFEGLIAYIADEAKLLFYNGSAWAEFASVVPLENLPMLGINATADATNKLTVASAAVLFNHIGASVQAKLNKNTSGDTASLLYQDNFSGRAELGLTGDDDLHVKVSPDGSSWFEALKIAAGSGLVSLIGDPTSASHAATKQYVDAVPGLLNVQRFVGAGTYTYTPTAGAKSILVLIAGAGGGGGGALASAGTLSAGSGGGGGNTLAGFFTGAGVASQIVTIGAGGAGGDAMGSNGSAGGSSSFGSLLIANGGSGGAGDASATTTPNIIAGGTGGSTGSGSGILFSRHGLVGLPSIRLSGSVGMSGGGATSGMLLPADGGNSRNVSAAGQTGGNAGAGGSGGLSNSTTGRAGGAGGSGECLVLEFH